ncbi:unnamed protein product, partial [Musa acuminata var. zebrina]
NRRDDEEAECDSAGRVSSHDGDGSSGGPSSTSLRLAAASLLRARRSLRQVQEVPEPARHGQRRRGRSEDQCVGRLHAGILTYSCQGRRHALGLLRGLPRRRLQQLGETASFGVERLRRHRRSIEGEADRGVPRLRRDTVSDRGRPRPCLHIQRSTFSVFRCSVSEFFTHSTIISLHTDEGDGKGRSKAFPNCDCEWKTQRQGEFLLPSSCRIRSAFVRLRELYYAGSHGMDIKGPTKRTKHTKAKTKAVLFQPATEFLPMIDEVYKALMEKTKLIQGSRVENNIFTLSVHFRCVDEKIWSSLAELVRSVLKDYPKLRLTMGRKVLEIRPSIKWDKGKALEFMLESLGLADSGNVFPVYIGDDRTDEDAFKVLHGRRQGLGILVSEVIRETSARCSLRQPAEVQKFLRRLVEWKRSASLPRRTEARKK